MKSFFSLKKGSMGRRILASALRITFVLATFGYGALLLVLYIVQDSLVFQPGNAPSGRDPGTREWKFDEVTLDVGGETTYGWHVFAQSPARGTVLFSHGNAGSIAGRLDSLAIFRQLGFDVLLYGYGGYGKSTGSPSEARCYADIRAMWNYLVEERTLAPSSIALFGRSLGGGPTCELARGVEAGAVVLESTFTSIADMGQTAYPFYPSFLLSLVIRHPFSNEDKIDEIRSPLLIVHSKDDELIPCEHGRKLYEKAGAPKTFLEIRGSHNGGFLDSGRLYVDGLAAFLHPLFPEVDTEEE